MARVTMFGRLADAAGWRERAYEADTLASLIVRIGEDAPDLARALQSPSVSVIVNDVLTRGNARLGDDDQVAFLPPMSGG